MTRKRFIKPAMGAGLPRNSANYLAKIAWRLCNSYEDAWNFDTGNQIRRFRKEGPRK